MDYYRGTRVNSPLGQVALDGSGSPVAVVRMDPTRSYLDVPQLLKRVNTYALTGSDTIAVRALLGETRVERLRMAQDSAPVSGALGVIGLAAGPGGG